MTKAIKAKLDWISKNARMPVKEDADMWGCIMVWDDLNGIKVCGWDDQTELSRPVVTYWAPLAERDMLWISKDKRLPTADDADIWGCVLFWDSDAGIKVCGYQNEYYIVRKAVTHWAPVPDRPAGRWHMTVAEKFKTLKPGEKMRLVRVTDDALLGRQSSTLTEAQMLAYADRQIIKCEVTDNLHLCFYI